MSNRRRLSVCRLLYLALILVDAPSAATAQLAQQVSPPAPKIPLTAGRSTVMATDFDITRIAVTNPAIADAVVVQPREVLIDGNGMIQWKHVGPLTDAVINDELMPALQAIEATR